MSAAKVAVTIDRRLLARVDRLVEEAIYPSRSRAIQEALKEKLERLDRTRLARECSRLDPKSEQRLAEEGLGQDLEEWPEY